MAPRRHRTVVYQPAASDALEALRPDEPRLEDIIAGFEWTVSHKPELGMSTGIPGLYAFLTRGKPWSITSMLFFYSFDANRVVVEDLMRADEPDGWT